MSAENEGYGTDYELWSWANTIHDEGRSDGHRGRYSLDPTLHLIPKGSNELWCSGGPAVRENTAKRRLCRRCLNLAREMWDDLADDDAPDDEEFQS